MRLMQNGVDLERVDALVEAIRKDAVNYPRLKPGACSGGPLWGTGLQFNRCEG